jgi:hypothetical protein
MQKYTDVVTSARSGAAKPDARVTVKTYPAGVVATIYSDDGVTTQDNPITTDSNGDYGTDHRANHPARPYGCR